jgi:fused signal recognition particle receptor
MTDALLMPFSGAVSKLRSRLSKGSAWLTQDLLGLRARRWDEVALEELETHLLTADVGVDATEWLIERLRNPSREEAALEPVEALENAIVELLRPVEQPLELSAPTRPFVILVVGVNGTGKTTSIGKLATRCTATGLSVMLAAGDTYRAAAVEQLSIWAERCGASLMAQESGADPAAVVHDALSSAKSKGVDVLIADTAGRLHTASGLMDELKKINRVIGRFDDSAPHETLLILDASQGQNALAQAQEFNKALGVTGLVITKLDGTAKGGILLAVARQLGIPVRFLAVGEQAEDLIPFDAAEFAAALLQSEDR